MTEKGSLKQNLKYTFRFELLIWVTSSLSHYSAIYLCNMIILLYVLVIIIKESNSLLWKYWSLDYYYYNRVEDNNLKVGEELWRETLPL
ncbi:uncharacterized protein LOC131612824 isoform X1 [Vicia villosa]|uniref:uncharacterized protein LOC131612824 isoform X1 n=1 Tax=Vicia villosa TaxID=3911 RepID=UPI00273B2335|nr:uncharacterized protein LOC131612824 isoform X1 [Vicia villosa]